MKPYLVLEWNDTETDARGWLCIYSYIGGYTGGGLRMHPSVTREEVIRLAEVMAYKRNATENVRQGGCKAGIAFDYKSPEARGVLLRFIEAMRPYIECGITVGADLGTSVPLLYSVFDELGIPRRPMPRSMREDPVVNRGLDNIQTLMKSSYDGWPLIDVVTGFGTAFAADEGWKQLGGAPGADVIVQGFGSVGASCAHKLDALGYKIVGVADANCFVYCADGLDVASLKKNVLPKGEMDQTKFDPNWQVLPNDAWIDYPSDIFCPAALADVLDKDNAGRFKGRLISEGANIPITEEADEILFKNGVHVVPDFIANVGAIRYLYVITFGEIEATPEAVVDDIEALCRRNVASLFSKAKAENRYERDVALEIFEPTVQQPPEW